MATDWSKYGTPASEPTSTGATDWSQYGTPIDGFQAIEQKQSSIFDAPYKSSPTDTGLTAGLKAAGNLPSSALRFGKGIFDIVSNPVTSAKAIGSTALGGFQKLIPGEQGSEQQFNQFTQALKQRYGSLEALQKTATEDPFGLGTDIVSLFAGGASLVGRGATAANIASKTARVATSPVTKTAEAVSSTVRNTARFATSQATGLSPSTISEIIKNPAAFGKSAANPSRTQIAEAVSNALDSRLGELSDIGSGYQEIRKAQGAVNIPANTVSNVLDKYGIKLKDGKVVTSPESRPLEAGDKAAIEKFIADYGNETTLSPNAFLNVREALSNLGDYNRLNPNGKTNISTSVARDLRGVYDSLGGQQLPGLKELDALYAPERQLLSQLKRDIFDAQGNLKDGAISKIANITGKGKEQFLERVKEVVPDIDQRINVLKAVEDIEAASGLKVGTYARAVVGGGGIATGNIPVIIGAILSQPEVAVPLLRAYGYTGQKAAEVLAPLRAILEDVNNFRMPAPVIDYLREQQPGLSMKKVPNYHPEDLAEMSDFTDYVAGSYKLVGKEATDLEVAAVRLWEHYLPNKPLPKTTQGIANEFTRQLEQAGWAGTKSSKQSTVGNISTSKEPIGKGGGYAPRTDTSAPFSPLQPSPSKSSPLVQQQGTFPRHSAQTPVPASASSNITTTIDSVNPKTVRVWIKSKFSDDGGYANVPVIRKVENITLYQGGKSGEQRQFWTPNRKYAEQFGPVREKTGAFYQVDNGNRMTDVYVEAPPSPSIPKELEGLAAEARKYDNATDFKKAIEGSYSDAERRFVHEQLKRPQAELRGIEQSRRREAEMMVEELGRPLDQVEADKLFAKYDKLEKPFRDRIKELEESITSKSHILNSARQSFKTQKDWDDMLASLGIKDLTDFFNKVKGNK